MNRFEKTFNNRIICKSYKEIIKFMNNSSKKSNVPAGSGKSGILMINIDWGGSLESYKK